MTLGRVCINHDPGMTLTFLRQGQLRFAHTFEWGKLLQ